MKDGAARNPLYQRFAKFNPAVLAWFPLFAAVAISIGFFARLSGTASVPGTFPPLNNEWTSLILASLFPALQLILLLLEPTARRSMGSDSAPRRTRLLIGVAALAIQAVWLRSLAGALVTEAFAITVFVGGLLTVAGFFMSKAKQNVLFGVRTAWTLRDARVWERTHRIAGPVTMVTGGLCFVVGMLPSPIAALGVAFAIILASAGLQIFYSYVVATELQQ